jgi:hypothetical protein
MCTAGLLILLLLPLQAKNVTGTHLELASHTTTPLGFPVCHIMHFVSHWLVRDLPVHTTTTALTNATAAAVSVAEACMQVVQVLRLSALSIGAQIIQFLSLVSQALTT